MSESIRALTAEPLVHTHTRPPRQTYQVGVRWGRSSGRVVASQIIVRSLCRALRRILAGPSGSLADRAEGLDRRVPSSGVPVLFRWSSAGLARHELYRTAGRRSVGERRPEHPELDQGEPPLHLSGPSPERTGLSARASLVHAPVGRVLTDRL